jgi:hypothetical protein
LISKRLFTFAAMFLGSLASAQVNDLLPYDSIATSYSKRMNDFNMQMDADKANLTPNRVRVNQAGYRLLDVKEGRANFYYLAASAPGAFSVVNAAGTTVATGTLTSKGVTTDGVINPYASNSATLKNNGDGDWKKGYPMTGTKVSGDLYEGIIPASVASGRYKIKVGTDTSVNFIVSPNVYGMVRDATIKFFGINRSGEAQSWFHGNSHTWDGWLKDTTAKNPDGTFKYKGALSGGWYDCGDHLKETRTQSFALAMLGVTASTMPTKDADHYAFNHAFTRKTDAIKDMVREIKWGAEFPIKAWRLADKTTSKGKLFLSVGDFGADHGWWGKPENQDLVTAARRGGKGERELRDDWGSPSLADWAAGLAFASRLWKPYDRTNWSDTALIVAKAFYAQAKATNGLESSPAYNGESKANDDMALAAVALLWATKDKTYLNDLVYTAGMPSGAGAVCGPTQESTFPEFQFKGGFMGCGSDNMRKSAANTDWASVQNPALYAFFKLILSDPDTASSYGVASESERRLLAQKTMLNLIYNLQGVSNGGANAIRVKLPAPGGNGMNGNSTEISVDPLWYTMQTQQEWVWNRYQMGNLADLYMYWDMTRDLDPAKTPLPNISNPDWKRGEVLKLLTSGMNMILGVNRLDVSWLMGVGTKNPNHPHHRASNPEGRNVPGALYPYRVPVGALYGGLNPNNTTGGVLNDKWFDYHKTETCLDGAAITMLPVTGLADTVQDHAPMPTIRVMFTTDTSADIQIDMDKWGTAKLGYGLDSTIASMGTVVSPKDTSNSIRVHVNKLTAATKYWFYVTVTDLAGKSRTVRAWANPGSDSIPFTFTTKATPLNPPIFGNIKVCNVTSDSADIMWYTPNGEYFSSVLFADSANWTSMKTISVDSDMVGNVPVKFHYVRLYGLKERTTYYFKVGVPGSWGAEVGCFKTPIKDVNFTIYTTQYEFGGMPFLGVNVLNGEARNYDSLTVRVYMRSTDTLLNPTTGKPYMSNLLSTPTGLVSVPVRFPDAIAARYDICQAYDPAGFNKPCDDKVWGLDWSWSTLNRGVQMLKAVKMPETYNAADNTYAWYFDLPLGPTMIQSQSRIRFDVGFARRSEYSKDLNQGQVDVLDWVKTFVPDRTYPKVGDIGWYDALAMPLWEHPILGVNSTQAWRDTTSEPWYFVPRTFNGASVTKQSNDWSWIPHRKADGAPIDFQGIVDTSKNSPDGVLYPEWINPYVTVYRKGDFVYGISPSKIEQATKRTVYAMNVTYDAPFNEVNGNTITITDGTVPRLKGTIDVYDQLIPGIKGYINSIWINGVKVDDATRKAALTRQADGTWKMDMILRLVTGTNKVDVTLFAGADSTDVDPVGVCSEGKGCAFSNSSWYVNNITTRTISVADLFDGDGKALTPDSTATLDQGKFIFQINDPDRDKAATAEVIYAWVKIAHKGAAWNKKIALTETGANTGIFRTSPLSVVFDDGKSDADAFKLPMTGPDTVTFIYVDSGMVTPGDTSVLRAFTRASFPYPDSGSITAPCGGGRELHVPFDMALPSRPDTVKFLWTPPGSMELDTVVITDTTKFGFADVDKKILTVDLAGVIAERNTSATGWLNIHVPSQSGVWRWQQAPLRDSVGPRLLQAQLYENFTAGAPDTLRAFFSEKPVFSGKTWPFALKTNTGTFVVDSLWEDSAAVNRWRMIVRGGTLKINTDSLKLAANVKDRNGVAAASCDPWVGLGLFTRPVPINGAWIQDSNGDGLADLLTVVFSRKLDVTKELPDSFVVSFGPDESMRASVKPSSLSQWTADNQTFIATLNTPFPASATKGMGVGGTGKVYVSRSGYLDLFTYNPVEDSVGPNAVSARLRYGTTKDTLVLTLTEGVTPAAATAFALNVNGTALGSSVRVDGNLAYITVDTGSVIPMVDSVRVGSGLSDRFGNRSGAKNPAVLVTGGDRPPHTAWFSDEDADGTIDHVKLVFTPRSLHSMPKFVFLWPNKAGFLTAYTVQATAADTGKDTVSLAIVGADSLVTGYDASFASMDLGMMIDAVYGDTARFAVKDRAAPVLVSAMLRYNIEEGLADTLSLLFSEPVVAGAGNVAVVRAVTQLLDFKSFEVDPANARLVRFFIDSNGTKFSRGDTLAAAPGSIGSLADQVGNVPGTPGRWVRLTFGPRAPVYDVQVKNSVLLYDDWFKNKPSVPGTSLQLLVREPNGDWKTIDGTVIALSKEELDAQGMGLVLTVNEGVSGYAYIYDNLGIYLAGIDLSKHKQAWDKGAVPTSASLRTQLWIRWDGRDAKGAIATSGVYTMRLITKRQFEGQSESESSFLNKTYKMGWGRKKK